MRNVLAFLALAAFACQSSAGIDIVSPIENAIMDLGFKCDLIKNDRHHKNIDPKQLQFQVYNTRIGNKHILNLEQAAEVFHKEYNFTNKDPIYLYVPGHNADPTSYDVGLVKDGITKLKNVNYVLLDSSFYLQHDDLNTTDSYLKSVSNAFGIGQVLGDALAKFLKNGLPPNKLHVFGHSLGAQIVGYAAQRVFDIRCEKLPRISGIDPARSCFDEMEIVDEISAMSAEYVDIYHSNMGVAGTVHSLGTSNFYINGGGPQQPSCPGIPFISVDCSHVYASLKFWVESALNPKKFLAQKCESYKCFKKGRCKDMPKAQAGFFSVPCKGNYYIEFEFNYLSEIANVMKTYVLRFWNNLKIKDNVT